MKSKIVIILLLMLSMTSLFAGRSYAPEQSFITQDNPKATGGIINASAKLIIQAGAYVIISGSGNYVSEGSGSMPDHGTLDVTGNFVNNNTAGEPVSATASVSFTGTTEQSISGNPISFGNVTFSNPAGINIGCDTTIAGDLSISESSGIITMTDYDFEVTGSVTGTPVILVTGSGAVGEVGGNANVTVNSPLPTGLPAVMNSLDVNPGAEQTYQLPNSTSVASLTFSSGNLSFGEHSILLRNHDLYLGGDNSLSAIAITLNPVPGTYEDQSSINKTWNITGQSSGEINITLRWLDAENNGNNFASGFANVFAHNGLRWTTVGRYLIVEVEPYHTVTFTRNLGLKDGANDYTITGDDVTLPVELSSFTATATSEQYVTLCWTTQSETNLCGFSLLRSAENTLSTAVCVSNLIPATNASQTSSYTYIDTEVEPGCSYYYWLQALELDGSSIFHGPIYIMVDNPEENEPPLIPLETRLLPSFPNPFNPSTTIRYELKTPETVTLSIYNSRGQLVNNYHKAHSSAGTYHMVFNGVDKAGKALSSGVYYCVMNAGKVVQTSKMVLLK